MTCDLVARLFDVEPVAGARNGSCSRRSGSFAAERATRRRPPGRSAAHVRRPPRGPPPRQRRARVASAAPAGRPATKPPMCAKYATPNDTSGSTKAAEPYSTCSPNQVSSTSNAGSSPVDEHEQRDGRQHAGARVEQRRSRRARRRSPRWRRCWAPRSPCRWRLRQRRREAAEQVEQQERAAAHGVLDVVAEDEQEQHVADQVQPAAVHEHRATAASATRTGAVDADLGRRRRRRRRSGRQRLAVVRAGRTPTPARTA